jgi:hypothetical protein
MLFHCNNGCTKAPQCYAIHKLPAFFSLYFKKRWEEKNLCRLNSNGYQVTPGDKAARACVVLTTHLNLTPRFKKD